MERRVLPIVTFAALAAIFTWPGAASAAQCSKRLPAQVKPASADVDRFERSAYLRVRPRGGATLRGIRVKVKFKSVTAAAGSLDGRLKKAAQVPLEFREPIDADRVYDQVVSGIERGCGKRDSTKEAVTFTEAGGGPDGSGGGGNPTLPGANVQGLTIDWSGGAWQGNDSKDVPVPGIGVARIACRSDSTLIRVIPDDPSRDSAIVAWTYRRWDDAFEEGSVQESSTNQFGGGEFNLGFNKFNPPEGQSRGTLTGVISDRLAFGTPGGFGAPPTAVELSWEWDFREGATSRCHIDANFTTEAPGAQAPVARSLAVNWRGDDAATANGAWTAEVPGLGDARIDCQASLSGLHRFILFPSAGVGSATFTAYEGSEVRTSSQSQGPFLYDVPNNGFVVADFGPGLGRLFLSSRWKANDPDASQNFCHLAGVLVGV